MGKGYSKDLRERAVGAYERGEGTYDEIAERFDVGVASLNRWLRLKRETGSVEHRPLGGGHPTVFDEEGLPKLVALVDEKPDRTLDELCEVWKERHGDTVSTSAVGRALERAGLTRKKSRSGRWRRTPRGSRS